MALPSFKAPAIDAWLQENLGVNRVKVILNDKCVSCKKEAENFTNDLSKLEYTISGLCQNCQNEVFRNE